MNTLQSLNSKHNRIMWTSVALALFTAFSYILIQFKVLGVGDLQGMAKNLLGLSTCRGKRMLFRGRIVYSASQSWTIALRGIHQCHGCFLFLQHVSGSSRRDVIPRRIGLEDRSDIARSRIDLCHCCQLEKGIKMKPNNSGHSFSAPHHSTGTPGRGCGCLLAGDWGAVSVRDIAR